MNMSGAGGKNRVVTAWGRLVVLGFLIVGLSSCGDDDFADLKAYIAEVKQRQKSVIEPLPEIKTVQPFVFDESELHDPFFVAADRPEQPTEDIKVENGIHPDASRTREELESYELDALRMVGTVALNNTLWGLVKATDGTIHRVHAGNYLGRNFGKIIRIKEDQIELMEIIPDSPGTWRERKASLELAAVSGGK
jgi:type IV pilus assembly protein PilP